MWLWCNTRPPPLFLNEALLFFRSQEYHQFPYSTTPLFIRASNNEWKMSQYTIKDSNNCLNTTNSYNTHVSNNYNVADDRSQLLTWLSPLEPSLRHCDIRDRRVTDIGEWFIQTEEFRRWCEFGGEGEIDKAVLFCYGDPGVGKTFMR